MGIARRTVMASLLAALAACARRSGAGTGRRALDTHRLADGFTVLAARARPGGFNLGVLDLHDGAQWVADPAGRYPLQGVLAAPLAAAVFAQVDAGLLTLNQRLHMTDADLSAPPSAINDAWPTPPEGRALDLPVVDLVALAVQANDNTAADALLAHLGGPPALAAWLASRGVADLRVDRYAREQQTQAAGMDVFRPAWKDEKVFLIARDGVPAGAREAAARAYLDDPRDTATAPAALAFLRQLATGALISPASTRLLLRLMENCKTGARRLKAGLPAGARLAHQTGSARTDLGLTPAINDIGLITLAGGRRIAVAAFLAGSVATEAERDALFTDAARLVMDSIA